MSLIIGDAADVQTLLRPALLPRIMFNSAVFFTCTTSYAAVDHWSST